MPEIEVTEPSVRFLVRVAAEEFILDKVENIISDSPYTLKIAAAQRRELIDFHFSWKIAVISAISDD